MSDTYGTWIYPHMMKADTVYRHTFENGVTLDISVPVGYNAREAIALLVSKDEEQPQVPAGEPVQEEADQDIPLDFDLTEACFRGLPPLVNAGKEQIEDGGWGFLDNLPAAERGALLHPQWHPDPLSVEDAASSRGDFDGYNPPVIPADPEGAPIAGTAEDAKVFFDALDQRLAALTDSPPVVTADNFLPGVDEPVESWAAEAEAKRWRGDMLHILSHCNICGAVSVHSEPHCAACREEGGCFTSFWTASAGTAEEALEAWDAAAYRRTWGGRQPQPFA